MRRYRRRVRPGTSKRVRGGKVPIPLRVGIPGGMVVLFVRWLAFLFGWGWVWATLLVYFVLGYIAADTRARETFGHRKVRREYIPLAVGTALVAWGVAWVLFSVSLMVWMAFQDIVGRVVGLVVWLPQTLPLAFIGGYVGGALRKSS